MNYIQKLTETKKSVAVLSAAFAGLGGTVAGYLIAHKRLEAVFAQQAQDDIDAMKQHYKLLYKEDVPKPTTSVVINSQDDDLREVAQTIIEKMEYTKAPDYDDTEPEVILNEPEDTPKTQAEWPFEGANVFESLSKEGAMDFDYETEVAERSPDKPYVITKEEFMLNETSFQQTTVTYYEGDDVLADENEQMINEKDRTVGEDNLYRFGAGSGDGKIVYVRNDRLELEFEIIEHMGKFYEEVLGFIQHSEKPRVRKFRGDDE